VLFLFLSSFSLQLGLWASRYWAATTICFALIHAALLNTIRLSWIRSVSMFALLFMLGAWRIAVDPITDIGAPDAFYPISDLSPMLMREASRPDTLLIGESAYVEASRWEYPPTETDRQWLLSPLSVLVPNRRPIAIPPRIEQMDPASREQLTVKLKAANRIVYFGLDPAEWLAALCEGRPKEDIASKFGRWRVVIYGSPKAQARQN
jgi:hypothetical protein